MQDGSERYDDSGKEGRGLEKRENGSPSGNEGTGNGARVLFEKAITGIEWLMTFFLIVIFSLTVILVILRYVFNTSILGGSELVTFLFIYTTALGSAVAIPKDRHIRIDYFINHLPKVPRIAVEVVVFLLIACINVVMILYSIDWLAKVGGDISQSLEIPLGIVKSSVPIGCSLAVIYSLYGMVRVLKKGSWKAEESGA